MIASPEARGWLVAVDGSVHRSPKGCFVIGMSYLDNVGDFWLEYFPYHRRFVFAAELRAVKKAVRRHHHEVHILCDSQGVVNLVQAWQRGEDLDMPNFGWDGLDTFRRFVLAEPDRFTISWTKGHAGHPLNEGADALARLASRTLIDGLSKARATDRAVGIAAAFSKKMRKVAA